MVFFASSPGSAPAAPWSLWTPPPCLPLQRANRPRLWRNSSIVGMRFRRGPLLDRWQAQGPFFLLYGRSQTPMIEFAYSERRLPNVHAPKNLGLLMYRWALVASTIAALLLCPLMCQQWGAERFVAHHPEAPEDAAATCPARGCCEGSPQADPCSPQPDDPCSEQGCCCICGGAAITSKLEDAREVPSPKLSSLGETARLSEASFSPSSSPAFSGGTLSASATGRLIRILLQSFLA